MTTRICRSFTTLNVRNPSFTNSFHSRTEQKPDSITSVKSLLILEGYVLTTFAYQLGFLDN